MSSSKQSRCWLSRLDWDMPDPISPSGEGRFRPVGSYLMVHHSFPTALQIVAVLHGVRDAKE
jgi:hypothetical protein